MFMIQSRTDLKSFGEGTIGSFTNGRGQGGSSIFPTKEMAEEVLKYMIKYHNGNGLGFYIEFRTLDRKKMLV